MNISRIWALILLVLRINLTPYSHTQAADNMKFVQYYTHIVHETTHTKEQWIFKPTHIQTHTGWRLIVMEGTSMKMLIKHTLS